MSKTYTYVKDGKPYLQCEKCGRDLMSADSVVAMIERAFNAPSHVKSKLDSAGLLCEVFDSESHAGTSCAGCGTRLDDVDGVVEKEGETEPGIPIPTWSPPAGPCVVILTLRVVRSVGVVECAVSPSFELAIRHGAHFAKAHGLVDDANSAQAAYAIERDLRNRGAHVFRGYGGGYTLHVAPASDVKKAGNAGLVHLWYEDAAEKLVDEWEAAGALRGDALDEPLHASLLKSHTQEEAEQLSQVLKAAGLDCQIIALLSEGESVDDVRRMLQLAEVGR